MTKALIVFTLIVASTSILLQPSSAQIRYARGQDVQPVFEGWEGNPDGTYSFFFGYFNRNYEEIVDVPVGPGNTFDAGGADRGQPTHFYPRRQMFVFKVIVPRDWDRSRKLIWTLTVHGHTNQAKGWLQPEWEVDSGVISENVGRGSDVGGNKAPSISGDTAQTVTLPETATLTVSATDDGLPKAPTEKPTAADTPPNSGDPANTAPRRRKQYGVGFKWIQYRGPGQVTFEPDEQGPIYGHPVSATTKATFSVPGTYVLRAIASDGALFDTHDVVVTVNAAKGAAKP